MMNDSTLAPKIAHFGFHDYSNGGGIFGIYDFLQQSPFPDRSIWVTEFNVWCSVCEDGGSGTNSWSYARGTADYLLSDLANGASAAFVWEGYDSQYNYYCPSCWSYWGLFGVDNINASPKTYTPRKQFYTLAQITKFVRPGAKRIDVSGSFGPLTLLAFYHPGLGQITLTGKNSSDSFADISGTFTSLPFVGSLDLYYTSADRNLSHTTCLASNQSFTATIPPDCIFTLTSSVTPSLPNGTYSGLYQNPDHVSPQSSGSISLTLTPRGSFSGSLLGSAGRYPFSGRFDSNGQFIKTVTWRGLSPLSLELQYGLSQNFPLLTATISSDTWSANGWAWRSTLNRRSPVPQAGRYTILFQGDTQSQTAPAGDGCAALTIAPSGKVRVVGSLADGTKFTASSPLSDNGISSFCFYPYTGQGLFTEWQSFLGEDASHPFGVFTWIKPPISNSQSYPDGFHNNFLALGSPYGPPANGQPILNITNADLVLIGGPLSTPITNHVILGPANKATSPEHATLDFIPGPGTFRGNAVDSDGQQLPFVGVILTNQNIGDGYFLRSNQSGQLLLIPR